jgi:hypothetical protein
MTAAQLAANAASRKNASSTSSNKKGGKKAAVTAAAPVQNGAPAGAVMQHVVAADKATSGGKIRFQTNRNEVNPFIANLYVDAKDSPAAAASVRVTLEFLDEAGNPVAK